MNIFSEKGKVFVEFQGLQNGLTHLLHVKKRIWVYKIILWNDEFELFVTVEKNANKVLITGYLKTVLQDQG